MKLKRLSSYLKRMALTVFLSLLLGSTLPLLGQTGGEPEQMADESGCENSIDKTYPRIIVTVCNRKTDLEKSDRKCALTHDSSCQFANYDNG